MQATHNLKRDEFVLIISKDELDIIRLALKSLQLNNREYQDNRLLDLIIYELESE